MTRKSTRDVEGSVFKRLETRKTNGREKKVQQWYARVRWGTADGKQHERKRRARSRLEAAEIRKDLLRDISLERAAAGPAGPDKTFSDLAEFYQREYLQPPVYVAGQIVSGLRGYDRDVRRLKLLCEIFGPRPLVSIRYEDLRAYKRDRMATPLKSGKKRTLAGVHRELQILRRMFNIAIQQEWLVINPFSQGDSLINISRENRRIRVLTSEEEARLLAQCTGDREHLKLIILLALDTASRKGELFSLRWRDIDFKEGVITLHKQNTKTGVERQVPMRGRLRTALLEAWQNSPRHPDTKLIAIASARKAFTTACRLAGITDFRFHDLRHTGTTALVRSIGNNALVMSITGHDKVETFMRYVNPQAEMLRDVADKLDSDQDGRKSKFDVA